jgi:hypothetical protein
MWKLFATSAQTEERRRILNPAAQAQAQKLKLIQSTSTS